jgi:mono/diheme cytochrome c family protein
VTARRPALLACTAVAIGLLGGCSSGSIEVPKQDAQLREGAQIFNQRCSGCHSLKSANAYGSVPQGQLKYSERTNGPNFNVRHEDVNDVLFAIRNGGFSGAIMPANIVVGADAQKVARFVCAYAGQKDHPKSPGKCLIPPQLK